MTNTELWERFKSALLIINDPSAMIRTGVDAIAAETIRSAPTPREKPMPIVTVSDQLLDKWHNKVVGVAQFGSEAMELYGEIFQEAQGTEIKEWLVILTVSSPPSWTRYPAYHLLSIVAENNTYKGQACLMSVEQRPSGLWRLEFQGIGKVAEVSLA